METYSASLAVRMLSYYHFPPIGAADFGPDIPIYTFGFPSAWVDTYRSKGFLHVDPLPRVAAQRTIPFWWSQIESIARLDAEEREYLSEARQAGFGDGLAIPVFGPNGRNGYYAAGFGKDIPHPEDTVVSGLHAACQFAHLHFCQIILQSLPESVSLSERESQILGYLVRGHSNQMIASQLKISTNTVDTYVRRCFEKLDVHDRVTAGLRGLALGLVA